MKKFIYLTNKLFSSICRGARDGHWNCNECVNCKYLCNCINQTNK